MQKVILNIGGMSCSACSNGLEKYLNKQSEIISASVNLVLGQALIEYEDNLTLDDSVQLFEKGMKISKECNEKLESAEKRITMLINAETGEEENFTVE